LLLGVVICSSNEWHGVDLRRLRRLGPLRVKGSRVELRPLRGLAPLDRLCRSPALRAGRVKSRRRSLRSRTYRSNPALKYFLRSPSRLGPRSRGALSEGCISDDDYLTVNATVSAMSG
jgi:hypothetical protein